MPPHWVAYRRRDKTLATNRVLIYDPLEERRTAVSEHLARNSLWTVTSGLPGEAFELFEKQVFHICLWVIDRPEDLDFVYQLKTRCPSVGIIVGSELSSPTIVVESMRAGASHFWNIHQGFESLDAATCETLGRMVPEEREALAKLPQIPDFIGRHPKIVEIFELIESLEGTDSNVLLSGESGTGKEVVAQAIHSHSRRSRKPWVAVNCGAIPANLLESELFGHVKGAFTGASQNRIGRFQMAGNGTLFLDEISELPYDLQVKILRAIQTRQFEPLGSHKSVRLDARIIAATNQDLERAVSEKRFREDLYYRLNVIPVTIPPLRSRKTDIPLLVRHFVDRFAKRNEKKIQGISEEVMKVLVEYHWPGNVRELENLIERIVVLKRKEGVIEIKDLPIQHFQQVRLDRFVANVQLPEDGLDFNDAVNQFENELILQALQKTSGNKNQAANLLNLNRTTLVEKLKRKNLRFAN